MEAHGFVIRNKETGMFVCLHGDDDYYFATADNTLLQADIFGSTDYFLTKGRERYYQLDGKELESVPVTLTI